MEAMETIMQAFAPLFELRKYYKFINLALAALATWAVLHSLVLRLQGKLENRYSPFEFLALLFVSLHALFAGALTAARDLVDAEGINLQVYGMVIGIDALTLIVFGAGASNSKALPSTITCSLLCICAFGVTVYIG